MNRKQKTAICCALLLMAFGGGLTSVPTGNGPMDFMAAAEAAERVKPDSDGYVKKVKNVTEQPRLELAQLQIPSAVRLADSAATPEAQALLRYLHGVSQSGHILYGHQNDMHRKVGKAIASDSDTYDITGDYPAVVGMDGLALTGNELELSAQDKTKGRTLARKLADIAIKADSKGAIVTMSCHMPNFAEVAKRPKVDGHYDYTGYSPDHTGGNVVSRILPGGDLNEVFNGYLDLVAEFDSYLQAANVPLIFRPFHENMGSWFWWGAGHCTEEEFRQLFIYTEQYLQGKGLHNMLYAYSPGGGETHSEADYAVRYPGNRYIDICGLDMYARDPERGDGFLDEEFPNTLDIVEKFAASHRKVAAVTETGILCGNSAMAKNGIKYHQWFTDASHIMAKHHMAYFLTWSNFNEKNFDQPYMVDEERGHEMVNDFVDFYNDPVSVFAKQNADWKKI